METIDCTPTWQAALQIVKMAYENNPKNKEVRKTYEVTLGQMADICEKVRTAHPDTKIGDLFNLNKNR